MKRGTSSRALQATHACTRLAGVGPRLAPRLAELGIETVGDVLLHRPRAYEDRSRVTPLYELDGDRAALVVVCVEDSEIRTGGRRRSLLVTTGDGGARLGLRFFHFGPGQQARLAPGTWLRVFGEARAGAFGVEMVHPEIQIVADCAAGHAIRPELTPVYPTVSGVSQNRLRDMTGQALALLDTPGFWAEALPADMSADKAAARACRLGAIEALRTIHRPPADSDIPALVEGRHPAVQRLAFEELLGHQIGLRARRRRIKTETAPRLGDAGRGLAPLFDRLGFAPTGAQRRVIGEILADMASAAPMLRLIQGDVGSGKTVVAAAAILTAVENGWQAAFMAPTELLAEQHHASLAEWLEPLGLTLWLITGRRKSAEPVLAALAAGTPGVAIGTHALFQEHLAFGRLGLCVIDEQHRFGVDQRLALRNKSDQKLAAHQLIMTATPIPRTLAMSAYADLDTSIIDELPPGRTPVVTVAVPNTRRDEVIARIADAVVAGRQAYWVCTLIEASDKLEAQAAEAAAEALSVALAGARVTLAHGRMRPAAKQKAMAAFKAGEIDILVATTVIEVGVDVPNASLMIIENAERLGLAQLHQLRGRVGRGAVDSHCVLLYQGPLSDTARRRLSALRATADGFAIARADLDLRGPGEVLGTRQTGAAQFKIADLMRDAELAETALAAADDVLVYHPREAEILAARWGAGGGAYAGV